MYWGNQRLSVTHSNDYRVCDRPVTRWQQNHMHPCHDHFQKLPTTMSIVETYFLNCGCKVNRDYKSIYVT